MTTDNQAAEPHDDEGPLPAPPSTSYYDKNLELSVAQLYEARLRLDILKFAAAHLPAGDNLTDFAAELADFVFEVGPVPNLLDDNNDG